MKVYNVKDVAEILKVSVHKVYGLLDSGQLKYFRLGRRRKISEHALKEFILRKERECQEEQSAS